MATENDIAWLAGFIDADGCFTMQIYRSKAIVSYVEIKPYITIRQIYRDDNSWVNKVMDIYDDLGVTYSQGAGLTRKGIKSLHIDVRSIKSAEKLAKALYNHLTVKKNIAKLFMDEIPRGKRVKFRGFNYDRKTGRFEKSDNLEREIDWESVHAAARFVDKVRKINTPKTGTKGRANVKWTGQKIIDFYKNLERQRKL